jgi:hypothetical protein
MTPTAIIADARGDGLILSLGSSGGLRFEGPRKAADKWVPLLRGAKPGIIAHLRRAQRASWDAEDWRSFFEERAAILEYDGGLPCQEAEVRALQCCVAEWLRQHPVRSEPGRCLACGESGKREPLIPYGTTEHAWLHGRCWPAWYRTRKDDAALALTYLGDRARRRHAPLRRLELRQGENGNLVEHKCVAVIPVF